MNNKLIQCLKSGKLESGACYGKFLIDSLNTGQGITIGNQLRRVLLSDLGGVAISAIRIAGITHEFSTIPGVREDILEILLNLKGITFKSKTQKIQFGRLKIQGPKVVTADMIQLPSDLEIVNPNHYIATVSSLHNLEIELKFEYGTGYKLASHTFSDEAENYLQLDTIFMPVQKVDFTIENVYKDGNNINERLTLDIWTNGSILPNEALESAVQIIIDLFTSLVKNKNMNDTNNSQSDSFDIAPYYNVKIEELHLVLRAYNCLKKADIHTVGKLLEYKPAQLLELRNFGRKSAENVYLALKNKFGIIYR